MNIYSSQTKVLFFPPLLIVICIAGLLVNIPRSPLQVSEHGEQLSANVSRLDSEAGRWEVETELPAQRSHHCLAVLGGFIFAAGGSSSRDNGGDAACNLLYRYDPRHNQWTRVLYQKLWSIPRGRRIDEVKNGWQLPSSSYFLFVVIYQRSGSAL